MKTKYLALIVYIILMGTESYAQHYITIQDLVKICSYNKRGDVKKIQSLLLTGGYTSPKLYANYNTFEDLYGNSITTKIMDNKLNGFEVRYAVKNPTEHLINSYKNYLTNYYTNVGYSEKGNYTKEGKFLIYIDTIYSKLSGKKLIITVKNNSGAAYPLSAIKIKGTNKRKITSFTNSRSILYLNKGDTYRLTTTGSISLGAFAGRTSPNGINGFQAYNYVSGFKHGALLGKLGKEGQWFLLGSKKNIVPQKNSHLYVKVNDIDPSNNTGYFILNYTVEYAASKESTKNATKIKTGCTFGNCQNGYGLYKYSNGEIYLGYFKNGKRHGYGNYLWSNSNYTGNWKNGNRHGFGKYFNKKLNTLMVGEWKNNTTSGFGYKINANLTIQRGIWQNNTLIHTYGYNLTGKKIGCIKGNCLNGYGKYALENNQGVYEGFFVNGNRYIGKFKYISGDKYEGEFNTNGYREGTGVYTYKNGDTYNGQWLNDKKHGLGVFKNKNGNSFYQNYYKGKQISSKASKI